MGVKIKKRQLSGTVINTDTLTSTSKKRKEKKHPRFHNLLEMEDVHHIALLELRSFQINGHWCSLRMYRSPVLSGKIQESRKPDLTEKEDCLVLAVEVYELSFGEALVKAGL